MMNHRPAEGEISSHTRKQGTATDIPGQRLGIEESAYLRERRKTGRSRQIYPGNTLSLELTR